VTDQPIVGTVWTDNQRKEIVRVRYVVQSTESNGESSWGVSHICFERPDGSTCQWERSKFIQYYGCRYEDGAEVWAQHVGRTRRTTIWERLNEDRPKLSGQ